MIKCVREKLDLLKLGIPLRKGMPNACELGTENHIAFNTDLAKMKDLGKDNKEWTAETFHTKLPNLDIRDRMNFSGQRRGDNRCYELPYWGRFDDVINEKQMIGV